MNKVEILTENLFDKCQINTEKNNPIVLHKTLCKILNTWKGQKFINNYEFIPKAQNKHYKLVIYKNKNKELEQGGQND